jgi:zinc/manganese transport system substrate-binding protein
MHRHRHGRQRNRFAGALIALVIATAGVHAHAQIRIVAAENFYGDVARQIGGSDAAVTSILANPDQDPHEFEASPSTARALADAAVVIYNGAGYDAWAAKLLAASPSASRQTIVVAELVHKKPGDNPHLWYDPRTVSALAGALADTLARLDPAHRADYRSRLARFEQSMAPLASQIAALRRSYAGTPVAATEPVFGYMADALGLDMRGRRFQLAVMNDTEPSAADTAAFEHQLYAKGVKVLIYNSQTSDALTRRMRALAQQAGIPVVGVTETEPQGKDYQAWMRSQLDALDRALGH